MKIANGKITMQTFCHVLIAFLSSLNLLGKIYKNLLKMYNFWENEKVLQSISFHLKNSKHLSIFFHLQSNTRLL